jgi:hypothetical protein
MDKVIAEIKTRKAEHDLALAQFHEKIKFESVMRELENNVEKGKRLPTEIRYSPTWYEILFSSKK